MRDDASGGVGAVAALALLVVPHAHVHLVEDVGAGAAAGPDGAPAGHLDGLASELVGGVGQADGADVVGLLNRALQGQKGNVVPLGRRNWC